MAVVTFSASEFRIRYPHLADFSDNTLTSIFNEAVQLYGNDDSSIFEYNGTDRLQRKIFLYAVTCHLASLEQWQSKGQPGRIASASEGSISTSFDLLQTNSDTAKWWSQTPCGALAWRMLAGRVKGGKLYGVKKNHPWG